MSGRTNFFALLLCAILYSQSILVSSQVFGPQRSDCNKCLGLDKEACTSNVTGCFWSDRLSTCGNLCQYSDEETCCNEQERELGCCNLCRWLPGGLQSCIIRWDFHFDICFVVDASESITDPEWKSIRDFFIIAYIEAITPDSCDLINPDVSGFCPHVGIVQFDAIAQTIIPNLTHIHDYYTEQSVCMSNDTVLDHLHPDWRDIIAGMKLSVDQNRTGGNTWTIRGVQRCADLLYNTAQSATQAAVSLMVVMTDGSPNGPQRCDADICDICAPNPEKNDAISGTLNDPSCRLDVAGERFGERGQLEKLLEIGTRRLLVLFKPEVDAFKGIGKLTCILENQEPIFQTPFQVPTRLLQNSSDPELQAAVGIVIKDLSDTVCAFSDAPTASPTRPPSRTPTKSPSQLPTGTPTRSPSLLPTRSPTSVPTESPTGVPSKSPTQSPSQTPSVVPTRSPTDVPTRTPSQSPSRKPTGSPTMNPSQSPSRNPTKIPSQVPSNFPSAGPSASPTETPTSTPSQKPTRSPSKSPTKAPTRDPTSSPTKTPSQVPTNSPTGGPSKTPTRSPSESPTSGPTTNPSRNPTRSPSESPSANPSVVPSKSPSESPTRTPTENPSGLPTFSPSETPTRGPTKSPSVNPSKSPTAVPSRTPSSLPTSNPSNSPTNAPTKPPTRIPTDVPTKSPSENPTDSPTKKPTDIPSSIPTKSPSGTPTQTPTFSPSLNPTIKPTGMPTRFPSNNPTTTPTYSPTKNPTMNPTTADCPYVPEIPKNKKTCGGVKCPSLESIAWGIRLKDYEVKNGYTMFKYCIDVDETKQPTCTQASKKRDSDDEDDDEEEYGSRRLFAGERILRRRLKGKSGGKKSTRRSNRPRGLTLRLDGCCPLCLRKEHFLWHSDKLSIKNLMNETAYLTLSSRVWGISSRNTKCFSFKLRGSIGKEKGRYCVKGGRKCACGEIDVPSSCDLKSELDKRCEFTQTPTRHPTRRPSWKRPTPKPTKRPTRWPTKRPTKRSGKIWSWKNGNRR